MVIIKRSQRESIFIGNHVHVVVPHVLDYIRHSSLIQFAFHSGQMDIPITGGINIVPTPRFYGGVNMVDVCGEILVAAERQQEGIIRVRLSVIPESHPVGSSFANHFRSFRNPVEYDICP